MKDDKKNAKPEVEKVDETEEKLRDEDLEDATGATFVADWEPKDAGYWFNRHE